MHRRTFLTVAAFPFCSVDLQQNQRQNTPPARRSTRVVSRLRQVSQERRIALERNIENKSPAELNNSIPEIDDIELLNGTSRATARKALRVIAWNTERGRHWRDGARLIKESTALKDPDVILLGEMDLGMARSSNGHTTREMAAALGMNYAYGVEFLEFTGGELQEREQYPGPNQWGYHGNAILSRYPLSNLRMLRFPGIEKWYDGKAYGASESEWIQKRLGGRMAIFATIRIGRDVTLISAHLESSLRDSPARKIQTDMILEELKSYPGDTPVILGGDLNGIPSESMFDGLRSAGFRIDDSNDTRGGTLQRTENGKVVLGDKYIDYLLVRGFRVVRGETSPKIIPAVYPARPDGKLLADHAIVTAKLEAPWL